MDSRAAGCSEPREDSARYQRDPRAESPCGKGHILGTKGDDIKDTRARIERMDGRTLEAKMTTSDPLGYVARFLDSVGSRFVLRSR